MDWLGHETPQADLDALRELAITAHGYDRPLIAVEVGCWAGQTTIGLAKVFGTVYAVDTFRGSPEMPAVSQELLFYTFCRNVGAALLNRVVPLIGTSAFWAEFFPMKAHLIFIDALHDYENVRGDIRVWWQHVRKGGILCGHDAHLPGVKQAIEEFGYDGQIANVWYRVKV